MNLLQSGIKGKISQRKKNPRDHWLDYAEETQGIKLVMETKMVLNILTLYLPLPLFWSLVGQVSSRWVFQASKMNGDIFGLYTIKPDQMIITTTVLAIVLIPLFETIVYPVIGKIGIKTPLHKIGLAFVCSAFAFCVAAITERRIESEYIHMVWLLPQYVIMAAAETLLWVANLSFAYTQAPVRMKSVMTASLYLTVAGGSLIVTLISGANLIHSQLWEYLFYVTLMIVNTIFFLFLAKNYKYVEKQ